MPNEEKRVLNRRGARMVDETEIVQVNGGFPFTDTVCTVPNAKAASLDGDAFTGDCILH